MPIAEDTADTPPRARLLLVEDDPKIASFLDKGLRREGFRLDWVSTGAEALARLERGEVDVLLLDLGLPDIDGLEVLRRMRYQGMDLPVIVVTGRSDPRDRGVAQALGVNAYLDKPFAWASLMSAVLDALEPTASARPSEAGRNPDQG
jgi:DNA-binding response OmpR family regulator